MTSKLSYDGALWIWKQLDQFKMMIPNTGSLASKLLKGWLEELKANALQRSVDYAYAGDIDLIHYAFNNGGPILSALEELKLGRYKIESNKAIVQMSIADKFGVPFYFSMIHKPDLIYVQDLRTKETEVMDYDEWAIFQRKLSRR